MEDICIKCTRNLMDGDKRMNINQSGPYCEICFEEEIAKKSEKPYTNEEQIERLWNEVLMLRDEDEKLSGRIKALELREYGI